MKTTIRNLMAFLIAATLLLGASCALAESRISVSGSGETLVSADTCVVNLGISARDKDVLKAQQKANEAIANIREALMANGIEKESINTDYLNIYAMYDYSADGGEYITAYNANSTLANRVKDMTAVGTVIDLAFGAGANTLNGINFSASDTSEAKAEALKAAVADARAKAEVLAEAAGMKITGIEIISEGGTYSYDSGLNNFSAKAAGRYTEEAMAMEYDTVVQAAKLTVSASVTITFLAE